MLDVVIAFFREFWSVLAEMSPYLLFGFLFAGILSVLIKPEFVERHLGGHGLLPSLKASLFGIPLPLCSCGVIPVAASLRSHGASKGATTAFLISTPQTGVDSIFVTYSLMGFTFAIFRPFAALVSGMIGGLAVDMFDKRDERKRVVPQNDSCSVQRRTPDTLGVRGKLGEAIRYGFIALPRDIGSALLIGLIVTGIIGVAIPEDFIAKTVGTGIGAMLIMMLLGLPVYVCATASVPIAAMLIMKGASPGAALVFLMTGPATNAAALATVWKILGRRTAVIYLASVAITALGAGILLDLIFSASDAMSHMHHGFMLPQWINDASAVLLILIIANALLSFSWKKKPAITDEFANLEGDMITLNVKGMTCEHCVRAVTRAIRENSTVTDVKVSLESGTATIAGDNVDINSIRASIIDLGYEVEQEPPK